ncbi:MAG: response regulator [Nitrospinae bacterium]|nr:response regulator [Nitrospinota bacterium]
MTPSYINELLEEGLPHYSQEIFKTEFINEHPPKHSALKEVSTVAHYKVSGEVEGDFVLFFDDEAKEKAAERFIELTIGSSEDLPCSLSTICLEIANIIVGHFVGLLGEKGMEVEIYGPGEDSTGAAFSELSKDFLQEKGSIVVAVPKEEGIAGKITVWGNFQITNTKEKKMEEIIEDDGSKKKILIVDDSPVMCSFLKKIFTETGYDVVGVAKDGVEAIEKFEETNPDLMTLDIIMPKMKGTEVLKHVMEKYPEAKVLMASSVSDARTVMQCLKIGAKRYIIKPYDKDAVMEAVEKALGI